MAAPTEVRELRRLVRYRQQLKRSRIELKLQIRALLREERVKPPARAWTRAWRAWLDETECVIVRGAVDPSAAAGSIGGTGRAIEARPRQARRTSGG